jgi:Tfp pilus assembly protein PilN
MRPVNLIPPEERRGQHSPLRTGPIVYVVLGALLLALAGVTALVLTNNEIADRKSEITQLRQEDAVASAKAQRLAAYTQFRTLSEQRVETVRSLADSRFDWERVMREFSLVLPSDVWLTSLTATAAPGVSIGAGSSSSSGSSGGTLRAAVPGPALELSGCARGQDGVAGFVTALKDIDGVTRVGVESSALPAVGSGAGTASPGGGESGGSSTDCRTRGFIAQFKMVVAFDAAPVPIAAGGAEEAVPTAAPEPAPEAAPAESTPTAGEE